LGDTGTPADEEDGGTVVAVDVGGRDDDAVLLLLVPFGDRVFDDEPVDVGVPADDGVAIPDRVADRACEDVRELLAVPFCERDVDLVFVCEEVEVALVDKAQAQA